MGHDRKMLSSMTEGEVVNIPFAWGETWERLSRPTKSSICRMMSRFISAGRREKMSMVHMVVDAVTC